MDAAIVETFTVRSWSEHMRQHEERWTGYERDVRAEVLSLSVGEPTVQHLFPEDVPHNLAAELNDERT